MKKDDAIKALDAAMHDGIGKLFNNLVLGLTTGRDAIERFERGLKVLLIAYASASGVIEAQFKD